MRGRTPARLTTRPHGGGGAGPGRRGPRAPASPARGSPRSTPPARSPGSSPSRRASGRRPKWPWRPATSSRPPRRRTPGSSGEAILNSTTLHNVLLPGAGTGGKTCPFRAMMAASDTVRRFRLPVPCSRLGLYDCRPGRSPGFLVAARMLPGRCPGLHAKRVRRGGRLNVDRRCLWPRLTTRVRRGGRLNVAGRRLSTSCSPVPGPCSRLCLYQRGSYSTPVPSCRFPVAAVVALAAPNNTRPPRRTAKCCSTAPFAVPVPGPWSPFPR